MSVIGRLDEGVEALLINPLKKRQTPDEEKRERSRLPAPATEEGETESSEEKPAGGGDSFPVWML
jgi:hypothetical protein